MDRRRFILSGTTLALLPALAALEGCPSTVSQAALLALVGEIATAWATLSPYLTNVDPTLAANITAEIAAVQNAIKAWTPGMSVANIEKVINTLVQTMSLIPVIAMYEPLVALIVATAEGILALITPGHGPITARGAVFASPPTSAKQFRAAWNKTVTENGLNLKLEIH